MLDKDQGIKVGYKAGLINKSLQEIFGAIDPLGEVLYRLLLLATET